jgi:hypothetical protein
MQGLLAAVTLNSLFISIIQNSYAAVTAGKRNDVVLTASGTAQKRAAPQFER